MQKHESTIDSVNVFVFFNFFYTFNNWSYNNFGREINQLAGKTGQVKDGIRLSIFLASWVFDPRCSAIEFKHCWYCSCVLVVVVHVALWYLWVKPGSIARNTLKIDLSHIQLISLIKKKMEPLPYITFSTSAMPTFRCDFMCLVYMSTSSPPHPSLLMFKPPTAR